MTFIRKHMSGGHIYYCVVNNYRINGKIKPKIIYYIGNEKRLAIFLQDAIKMKDILKADIENLSYQTVLSFWNLLKETKMLEVFKKYLHEKHNGVKSEMLSAIMVMNYAIERKSKLKLHEWYDQTYLKYLTEINSEKINKDNLCRTLDYFNEQNIEQMHGEIFENVKQKFKLSNTTTFYDLTTVTFEGNCCEIAKRGYNPNHFNKLQINVGLATSSENFPIIHKTFEGNKKDVVTLEKIIGLINKLSDVSKTIFIFDRGIASKNNFEILEKNNVKYIAGLPKNNNIKKQISLIEENEFTKINELISFYEINNNGNNQKIIIYQNKELASQQNITRERKTKKITEKLKNLQKNISYYPIERLYERVGQICNDYRTLFNISINKELNELKFEINNERLIKEKLLDGKYAIVTNTTLSPEIILLHYRNRNLIEMCFKDLKMFVDLRPTRHWKTNRVLAHIFLAILGFGLKTLLELKLKRNGIDSTANESINKLNRIRVLCANGKILRLTGENEETTKIVDALSV